MKIIRKRFGLLNIALHDLEVWVYQAEFSWVAYQSGYLMPGSKRLFNRLAADAAVSAAINRFIVISVEFKNA
ncbi:hypothetical protein [Mucilaginibacter ginsenosidivorax]|nr:hypothetical protein [Mucilaginibacter ginsenosidivorax]